MWTSVDMTLEIWNPVDFMAKIVDPKPPRPRALSVLARFLHHSFSPFRPSLTARTFHAQRQARSRRPGAAGRLRRPPRRGRRPYPRPHRDGRWAIVDRPRQTWTRHVPAFVKLAVDFWTDAAGSPTDACTGPSSATARSPALPFLRSRARGGPCLRQS